MIMARYNLRTDNGTRWTVLVKPGEGTPESITSAIQRGIVLHMTSNFAVSYEKARDGRLIRTIAGLHYRHNQMHVFMRTGSTSKDVADACEGAFLAPKLRVWDQYEWKRSIAYRCEIGSQIDSEQWGELTAEDIINKPIELKNYPGVESGSPNQSPIIPISNDHRR